MKTDMMTRRGFLSGFAAFAAGLAHCDAFAVGKDLPEVPAYYSPYLAERIAAINRRRMEDGLDAGFLFVTDPHILSNHRRSGALIARLVRETGIRRVICGGDLPVAFGSPDDLRKTIEDLWPTLWREPIAAAGATLTLVKGNHDFHITERARRRDHVGLQYSAEETAKILRACNGNAALVTDATNPAACYGYADDPNARVRYVFADTSDAPCRHQTTCGVKGGHIQMSARQLAWLATEAFGKVPAGFALVVVQHVPLAPLVSSGGVGPSLLAFRRLMEAYQARRAVEVAGARHDFSSRVGGDIVVNLTGHHHSDRQSWFGGILHLSESCDAKYADSARRSPFSGKLPKKARGTVFEQTFDCVQFNARRGLLSVTRFGGGQDRVYHLSPVTVRVGDAARLEARHLAAPLSWLAVDSDTARINPKAAVPEAYWTFSHDHGSVSADGVFTAATPGPALALALDAALRKEVFPVTVLPKEAK